MSLLNQQMKLQILFFWNKVASDTISKYKQEFDNNKFSQSITNIDLDDMFTTGLRELEELNKKD